MSDQDSTAPTPDEHVTSSILVEGVTHQYGSKGPVILDNINLHLESGFYGLLGTNGAGKSTLMRIICTLMKQVSGRVTVNGLDTLTDCMAIRRQLGYLPQSFSAWRLLRTEEVLDRLARLSGLHEKQHRKDRVRQILVEVGLSDVAERRVKKLSGGMVRRLGVAQALVHDPNVIVVDEPTVGLDPEERIRFRHLMANLGKTRTILCSTHIVSDLGSGCKEIALLDDAKIAFQDTPDAFINQAKGRVFEVTTTQEQAFELEERYEIGSRETTEEGITIRIVIDRDNEAPPGSKPVDDPTLEEAYLAFMGSIGKFDSIRADRESDLALSEGKKKSRKSDRKKA